jgi:undecaprenyl-phosphate 4-deoxy-4-formamido-L-arabinose transferase
MSETTRARVAGISVVVPAYRTPGTLPALCEQLLEHVEPLTEELELVVVDDGSPDDTWRSIQEIVARHQWVRGIRLLRNYGQHNALLAGMRAARLPLILTMDDDLQNPPGEVHQLVEALTDDVDLVYGTPIEEPQSIGRNAASILTKRTMARLLGPDVYPKSSAFRLFRRELLGGAEEVHDPFLSIDVLLSWSTTRVTSVDVHFARRTEGRSGYSFRKLVRHAFNMITGYSTRPLRIVSVLGFLFATFGFGLLAFVLLRYVFGSTDVAGFTFIAAAISMFSGVQLLSLGVVGEYLARMHFRSMGRPPYVVRTEIGSPPD